MVTKRAVLERLKMADMQSLLAEYDLEVDDRG